VKLDEEKLKAVRMSQFVFTVGLFTTTSGRRELNCGQPCGT